MLGVEVQMCRGSLEPGKSSPLLLLFDEYLIIDNVRSQNSSGPAQIASKNKESKHSSTSITMILAVRDDAHKIDVTLEIELRLQRSMLDFARPVAGLSHRTSRLHLSLLCHPSHGHV